MTLKHIRHQLAHEIDPAIKRTIGLSKFNKIILCVILLSLIEAILETEHALYLGHEMIFFYFDMIVTTVFLVEYLLRLWVCVENPKYRSRWHYLVTVPALLDLLMVIIIFSTTLGAQGFILRLARIFRMVRIARLGHYSIAIRHIRNAISERRDELYLSFALALMVLLISSTALYFAEKDIQPEKFGSIPRAMWCSIATLTTVGYGDIYPMTVIGKFVAALTALAGIGFIALPAGILASSFSEALQRIRKKAHENPPT